MNQYEMAGRDPALAALMGAIPGTDFGAGFGGSGVDFGFGGFGHYGFGQSPVAPSAPPPPPASVAAWNMSTEGRTAQLDPNRHSTVKVERYSFSFSPASTLALSTPSPIPTFTQQPSTSIKCDRLVVNAPIEGFVLLSTLQIANVNVFVGGVEDAFTYSGRCFNTNLNLPRLDPQNRASASGSYSGALPPGFTAGTAYTLVITLQGPSTMAGGYGQ